MENVRSLRKQMRSKRKCAEEDGGGRRRLGGELDADQLVLEIVEVLGVRHSLGVFFYSFYLDRKLVWNFWKSS